MIAAPAPLRDPKPIPRAALAPLDPPAPCPAGLLKRLAHPQQSDCPLSALLDAARAVDAALVEVLPAGPRAAVVRRAADHRDLDLAWLALRIAIAAAEG